MKVCEQNKDNSFFMLFTAYVYKTSFKNAGRLKKVVKLPDINVFEVCKNSHQIHEFHVFQEPNVGLS
jgi:hypothetical protein